MVVLTGKFDGKNFVADQVPADLPAETPVRIVIPSKGRPSAFSEIAANAIEGKYPADFAAQHEHYVKGTPRK